MMRVHRIATGLAAAIVSLAIGSSAAGAQGLIRPGACIPRPQMEALVAYALPGAIDALAVRCQSVLPTSAYLRRSAGALASRYRADSERHWPAARGAIASLMGTEVGGALDETTEKAMLTAMIGVATAGQIKTKDCGQASDVLELLSPLPATNVARLTTLLLMLGTKSDKVDTGGIKICPETGTR